MWVCVSLMAMSLRQHLANPDIHTGEVHACSAVQHQAVPIAGFLQEVGIPQPHAIPFYLDSSSTIFAGNVSGSVRKSIWTLRRVDVIKDAVMMKEIELIHIEEKNNVADSFTKVIPHETWRRHMEYILNRDVS